MLILFACVTGVVFFAAIVWMRSMPDLEPTRYGVTFSDQYARQLGLHPKETYRALIEELGVRAVRLPVYWSVAEKTQGQFDWEMYDWLVDFSDTHDVSLTMVVGVKVPRWPECYMPDWVKSLDETAQQRETLAFIEQVVERYKPHASIERWQVENEPFFPFGECQHGTALSVLKERVERVRSLDPRPIQLTSSGELGLWGDLADLGDVLGISMYRKTWNDTFGYFMYPIGPDFYQLRAQLVRGKVDQVIVSELQAEPWFAGPRETYSDEQAYELFTKEHFESNLSFVRRAGLSEVYFWGAEWWMYLKSKGDDRLWNVAQDVFEKK